MKVSFLLALTLTSLFAYSHANPLDHLGSCLKQTTTKLSVLAQNGFNNANFNSLVHLLNTLFANMQVLSEPYFNTMITQIVYQNKALLNQIVALENQTEAQSTLVFKFLDAGSTVLSSQLGNIGGILVQYQNTVNPQILSLQNSMATVISSSSSLPSLAASITQTNGQIQNSVNTLISQQATDQVGFQKIMNMFPYLSKFALNSVTLSPSDLTFCRTFAFTFPNYFVNPPIVYANLVTSVDPSTVNNNGMDIILLSNNAATANFMVCDRSYSTFTLISSWVEIAVYSVDL